MKITKDIQAQARQMLRLCLDEAGTLLEDRVRMVSATVVEKKPRHAAELLSAFTSLVRLEQQRHTATVQSAVPLTEQEQTAIRAKLDAKNPGLQYDWQVKPELIAGIRVCVGDRVTDASVLARIRQLAPQD